MVSFEMNDRKKIGLGLTGFGVFFSFLGIIFFFDKGLLAMGNILFFSGVTLTIGLKSSMQFFTKRSNFKGTVSFGIGFVLVVIGWPIIGMMVEAYGFVVLFSGFWPTVAVFLQKIPVFGWLLKQPFVRSLVVGLFSVLFNCGVETEFSVFPYMFELNFVWRLMLDTVAYIMSNFLDRSRGRRVPV